MNKVDTIHCKTKSSSLTPALALALLLQLVLPVIQVAAQRSEPDPIRTKLEELEKRLSRLEDGSQAQTSNLSVAPSSLDPYTVEVQELRRQLDVLATELEQLRSGEPEAKVTPERARAMGLGSSAASVYGRPRGVSLAGYGELLYQNFNDSTESGSATRATSQFDFLRAVLYAGYRFNEKFVFNSEIELEHTNEASLEFAYIDYMAHRNLTLRGGLLLVPMGLVNELHEPNVFLGARRTESESRIIPSTWRENGFGVLGTAGILDYRAYVINGLNANGFTSDGLRGGRQKGANAKASDLAFVARLDVSPTPGFFFGGSVYTGGSGQDQFHVGGQDLRIGTTLGEVHGQLRLRGADVRTLFARAMLGDAAALNGARGLAGKASIAETLQGGYIQAGYNVLSQFRETPELTPYYRFEKLNTQHEMPPGTPADPARDRTFHTFGFEFKPAHGVSIKTDYQWFRNVARSGVNQFNLALGYAF